MLKLWTRAVRFDRVSFVCFVHMNAMLLRAAALLTYTHQLPGSETQQCNGLGSVGWDAQSWRRQAWRQTRGQTCFAAPHSCTLSRDRTSTARMISSSNGTRVPPAAELWWCSTTAPARLTRPRSDTRYGASRFQPTSLRTGVKVVLQTSRCQPSLLQTCSLLICWLGPALLQRLTNCHRPSARLCSCGVGWPFKVEDFIVGRPSQKHTSFHASTNLQMGAYQVMCACELFLICVLMEM
jgi:hypothetical protein